MSTKNAEVADNFQLTPTESLAVLVRELNDRLARIANRIATIEGQGDRTATFRSDIDMQGKRIRGIGHTVKSTDVPNVEELMENAMYARNGRHKARHHIEAPEGVSVPWARHKDHVVPLEQVRRVAAATTITIVNSGAAGYPPQLGHARI